MVLDLEYLNLEFVQDLDIRISNLKLKAFDLTSKLDINFKILAYEDV